MTVDAHTRNAKERMELCLDMAVVLYRSCLFLSSHPIDELNAQENACFPRRKFITKRELSVARLGSSARLITFNRLHRDPSL